VIEIGYLAAFLGGVLTLISPCGALLLPSFFAYAFDRPTALLARTGVFYLGLAVTLVPLGMGASLASALFFGHRDLLILVAGWLMIGLGVAQVFGGGFALRAAQRAQGRFAGRTGAPAIFGLGAVYGLAGFCSGPILGAVLTVAATDGRPLHGGALLAVYAFGMAGPLFALALLWDRYDLGRRGWLRGRRFSLGRLRLHTTSAISGLLFVGIGVLFLTTDGTGSGIPGLPSMLEAEASAQAWLQRLDAAIPDGAVLGLVAAIALAVLVVRLWRGARTPSTAADRPSTHPESPDGTPDPTAGDAAEAASADRAPAGGGRQDSGT
jgi:cytochrome c biogenesis protein CcdA